MEPLVLEILQWVLLAMLLPGLVWIANMLIKVRGTQVAILNGIMELHKWHAPQMLKAIEKLIDEIGGLRGDFRDVVPKLQEEHRVQDRVMENLTKGIANIEMLLQQRGRET